MSGSLWGSPPRMRGKVQPVQPPGRLLGITPAYAGKRRATALRCRCTRDHPRICGEKCNQRVRMVEQPGSPPHMRGKDMGLRASRIAGGITPAYAGKRNRFRFASFYKRDHPRICGEKYLAAGFSSRSRGSPPHMRGKVRTALSGTIGKKDHPRICGEKCLRMPLILRHLGSPPHMRGKGSFDKMAVSCLGITPAYAGKSVNRYHDYFSSRDHPRICGEKDLSKNFILPELGSPPHMRGKGIKPCYQRVTVGITPAYAGKSLQSLGFHLQCGEKPVGRGSCRLYRGSPPHMRGKVSAQTMYLSSMGITPAYAGKRLLKSYYWWANQDHPRICGEKKRRRNLSPKTIGSPPHMRGKVLGSSGKTPETGITPAYAGKSCPKKI